MTPSDAAGKVCLLTGATGGIGLEAAIALGRLGMRLHLVGRSPSRLAAARQRILAVTPTAEVGTFVADLSSMAEVRRLGQEVRAALPRLDVLVNNAGAIFTRRQETPEGLERTFALNHMAYFTLTQALRGLLEASAPARIVSVASRAHRGPGLDFDDLQLVRGYTAWKAYQRSKLANILFTTELARRLVGTGVTANCLHPGFVASGFGDANPLYFRLVIGLAKRFAISPPEGGQRIVHLATAPELASTTGSYFVDFRPETPSAAASDPLSARRLWEASERLAGQ